MRNILLEKSCRKCGREISYRPLFNFSKKPYVRTKQVVGILQYFGSPQLEHTMNSNCTKFQTVDPEIFSNLIL